MPPSPSQQLAALAERYWRFECEEIPLTAVMAGEETKDAVIFRESAADHERRNARAGALRVELDGIDATALSGTERATVAILDHELDRLRRLHNVKAHLRPSIFPAGPDFTTVFWANSTGFSDADGARRFTDRLATLPAYMADAMENLRLGHAAGYRYPQAVLECAKANTRALIAGKPEESPWLSPFRRTVAKGPVIDGERNRAEVIVRDGLFPSLQAFANLLETELADGARTSLSCAATDDGKEHYRVLVKWFTTTDMTPGQIHELGLAEVERISREIDAVAADAGFAGNVDGYRHHLVNDKAFRATSADDLLGLAERTCKRIDGKIPAFFSRVPRMTYGVDSIPPAMAAAMPPAYAQPNPGDRSSAGIFWVSSLPEKCPTYIIPALAVHEAWPGHLMHIGLMQEIDELPMFRRHGAIKYTACIEGWALYCEQLGLELGIYQTPHHHYGRLEMEMWRAARLVVDTGIHWYDWSREQAIDYMAARLTLSRATIAAEVDRYAALPAQALGYQIGGLKVRGLRAKAEKTLGPRFNLRAFHEVVMTACAVPLPVLEAIVDDWIALQDRG